MRSNVPFFSNALSSESIPRHQPLKFESFGGKVDCQDHLLGYIGGGGGCSKEVDSVCLSLGIVAGEENYLVQRVVKGKICS
ncbi:hypothetical protein Tco_0898871 [Tanacetum coccineum]